MIFLFNFFFALHRLWVHVRTAINFGMISIFLSYLIYSYDPYILATTDWRISLSNAADITTYRMGWSHLKVTSFSCKPVNIKYLADVASRIADVFARYFF